MDDSTLVKQNTADQQTSHLYDTEPPKIIDENTAISEIPPINNPGPDLKPMNKFKGIAFEGGGIAGLAHLGVIQYLDDNNLMQNITHISGASAGSVIAALVALRLPRDVIKEIMFKTNFSKFGGSKWMVPYNMLYRIWTQLGWNSGNYIEEWIGEILQKYVNNKNITFKEVSEKFNTFLIIAVTDYVNERCVYHSPITSPDLPIRVAIRESCSIPIYYTPVFRDENIYVDGGTLNNYPIRKLYEYVHPDNVCGVKLVPSEDHVSKNKMPSNFIEYVCTLIKILHKQTLKLHVKKEDWERSIIVDVGNVSTTDFDITEPIKEDLIKRGFSAASIFFSKQM